MISGSPPRPRLKAIIERNRGKATPPPSAGAPLTTSARVLLDKKETLPDPRALLRMLKSEELDKGLPADDAEAERQATQAAAEGAAARAAAEAAAARAAAQPAAAPRAAVFSVAEPPPPPPPEAPPSPPMSPAEVRNVLRELQSAFTSTAAPFSTVEISAAPRDQSIQPVAEEAEEEEARGGEWLYLVGAAVALLLIIGFLYAALAGPLKQTPGPTATPTPGAATPSAASSTR